MFIFRIADLLIPFKFHECLEAMLATFTPASLGCVWVCPSATTVLKTNSCQEVIVVEADRVRYTLALKIAQTISDLISAVAMQSGELMPACMLTLEMRNLN